MTIPVLLALAVWGAALLPRPTPPPPAPAGPPVIRTGTATELAKAICTSSRAIVYVSAPNDTIGYRGQRRFLEAAPDIDTDRGSTRFFVIEDEFEPGSVAWAANLRDARLEGFGTKGYGWLLWLEKGRLRDVKPIAGYLCYPSETIVEQTRQLWPLLMSQRHDRLDAGGAPSR